MKTPVIFKLQSYESSQGHSSSDLFVEIKTATLASGTVEVPTVFENGNIKFVSITKVGATVNSVAAFATDMVVENGSITVVGPTGDSSNVVVMIVGTLNV